MTRSAEQSRRDLLELVFLDFAMCSAFEGVVKGVSRALLGRRASQTPKPKRASAKRREEKDCMEIYMIRKVAAEHLGWGQVGVSYQLARPNGFK